MNILFLTMSNNIDIRDKQSIYGSILHELDKDGHRIIVASPNERRNKKPTTIRRRGNILYIDIKTGNIQKTNIVEKGISTILLEGQFTRAIKKYTRDIRFDLILYSTPPITFCNVIKYFKKRDNAHTYLMLKDIFPQNAVDLRYFSKKSLIYKLFRKKEMDLYNLSDKIGCMSPANEKYLLEHNDFIDRNKVELLPNSIIPDTKNKRNLEINNSLRKKYHISQKATVFMYGGNLGKPQGINFVINCLRKTKDINSAFFVICGHGTEYKKIKQLKEKEDIGNLLLINGLSKKEYTELLNIADIGLIFLDNRFTIPNFPSRLLSYCEKGIPTLCCTDSATDIGTIVEKNKFGFTTKSDNVNNFVNAVKTIINNKNNLNQMGEKAYSFLEEQYNSKNNYKIITTSFDTQNTESILIISNNVLSTTNNNGKTLYSFVKGIRNIKVNQLYFSSEIPEIKGINYYRINDRDVIRGHINTKDRGRVIECRKNHTEMQERTTLKRLFGKTPFTQLIREFLWIGCWKSKKLDEWLNHIKPTAILFCAGDSVFAYKIANYITKKHRSRITMFITDDYVMPAKNDSIISIIRKKSIRKNIKKTLKLCSAFYTISPSMQTEYEKLFNKKSKLAINCAKPRNAGKGRKKDKRTVLVYTGSLYYGRDEQLSKIGKIIKKWNDGKNEKEKAILEIYTNKKPDEKTKKIINIEDCSIYSGSLTEKELEQRLHTADILVFVESFRRKFSEKTKYSLSTKVPEYLRQGKPVLAIGPSSNGSMQLLRNAAYCIDCEENIEGGIMAFLDNEALRNKLAIRAKRFYRDNYDFDKFQKELIADIVGKKYE